MNNKGFTLIELTIGIGIALIIFALFSSTIFSYAIFKKSTLIPGLQSEIIILDTLIMQDILSSPNIVISERVIKINNNIYKQSGNNILKNNDYLTTSNNIESLTFDYTEPYLTILITFNSLPDSFIKKYYIDSESTVEEIWMKKVTQL